MKAAEGQGWVGKGWLEDAEFGGYHEFLVGRGDGELVKNAVGEVCDRGVRGEGKGMRCAMVSEGYVDFSFRI